MSWVNAIIVVFCVVIILIVCEMYRESKMFVVRTYDVKLKGSSFLKNHNLVFISDLHNHTYGEKNQKLLQKIKELKPDMVLVGGDIPVAKEGADLQEAIDFVAGVAKEHKVYYANGNHEHRMRLYPEKYGRMYEDYYDAIKDTGIEYLINDTKTVMIEDTELEIAGVEIPPEFYKRIFHKNLEVEDMESLLGEKKDRYTILLAHNPEYFRTYAEWGADMTLSGHVHGGVVRLPFLGGVISPSLTLFPKYDGGRKKEFGKEMIISRGMGVHTIPIRLFNPAELVVLRFLASEE